jgi:DNA mismatch repair protein MutL
MNRIQQLDENLINKIAAGEVVERPASVVKELVENSIDAGATKITIELQDGGRQRIVISDNGHGMSPDDARLAIIRHATSKISSTEDLFNLQTMGFRGEALASISAVSRFVLMTCEQGKPEGVRLSTDGGGPLDVTPWQSSGGTTIICNDIFYNVPVRQKFLKSAQSEYGAVLELSQALALSHPEIDLTLVHNGKEVLRAPAVPGAGLTESRLRARFAQVMRGDGGLAMVYKTAESPWATMTALASAPGVERGSAKDMFLFVNGRWVRDKSLRFAVLRGYHSHLLRGKYPVVALFLNLDAGLVDANVHPAKTEVRLQYANEIHGMVANAVREALRSAEWSAASSHQAIDRQEYSSTAKAADDQSDDQSPDASKVFGGFSRERSFSGSAPKDAPYTPRPARWHDVTPEVSVASRSQDRSQGNPGLFDSLALTRPPTKAMTESFAETIPWKELCYMGSIADCYLLFSHGNRQSGSRLLGVDQHAFHERVLYERLIRNTDLLCSSQRLLVPEGVTLEPGEIDSLRQLKTTMEQNGFSYDVIDDQTIEVRAVPVILAKADISQLMEAIARHESSAMPIDGNVGLAHDMLATMACHGAVRAGEALGEAELRMLIGEASDVDFYHNCPHGRRVFRWWDEAQIARWFDR